MATTIARGQTIGWQQGWPFLLPQLGATVTVDITLDGEDQTLEAEIVAIRVFGEPDRSPQLEWEAIVK